MNRYLKQSKCLRNDHFFIFLVHVYLKESYQWFVQLNAPLTGLTRFPNITPEKPQTNFLTTLNCHPPGFLSFPVSRAMLSCLGPLLFHRDFSQQSSQFFLYSSLSLPGTLCLEASCLHPRRPGSTLTDVSLYSCNFFFK